MKDKRFGNPDVKETARELTEAERRRLERFEALAEKMNAEGYRRIQSEGTRSPGWNH